MSIKDNAAIVGIGAAPYFRRGESYPETELSMACTAILAALEDAAAAVHGGLADCIVTLMTLQQLNKRLGGTAVGGMLAGMGNSSSVFATADT